MIQTIKLVFLCLKTDKEFWHKEGREARKISLQSVYQILSVAFTSTQWFLEAQKINCKGKIELKEPSEGGYRVPSHGGRLPRSRYSNGLPDEASCERGKQWRQSDFKVPCRNILGGILGHECFATREKLNYSSKLYGIQGLFLDSWA
jgi:hypothetical protein